MTVTSIMDQIPKLAREWASQRADRQSRTEAEYLFLNPSCCGAEIDSDLWDLLIEQRSQPLTEEASNV